MNLASQSAERWGYAVFITSGCVGRVRVCALGKPHAQLIARPRARPAELLVTPSKEFLRWLAEVRRYSPATIRTYGSTLRQWDMWWDCDEEPSMGDLEEFSQRQRFAGKPPAPASVSGDIVALKSYYKWRVRTGLSEKNPAADLLSPKMRPSQPRAIADEVWGDVWLSAPDEHRAWLGLGFFCGLRRAELVALQGHHLQREGKKLVGFRRKGGGDHTVPIGSIIDVFEKRLPHLRPDLLWPVLEGTSPHGPLCGMVDTQQLARALDVLVARAGVPRFTPHALRHSAVTNLLRADVPLHLVAKLMNHTTPATTMRYVRAGGDELSEWLSRK